MTRDYASSVIDIALLREEADLVRASQRARGERVELVDEALAADAARRAAVGAYDRLRNEQKTLGKSIGPLQGAVKRGDTGKQAELDALMATASALAAQVEEAERAMREADAALREAVKDAAIKEQLAADRLENTLTIQQQSKERTDAIQAGPDDHVSAAQRRLNCQRLRDAGFSEAQLAGRC